MLPVTAPAAALAGRVPGGNRLAPATVTGISVATWPARTDTIDDCRGQRMATVEPAFLAPVQTPARSS